MSNFICFLLVLVSSSAFTQVISGKISSDGMAIPYASVGIRGDSAYSRADSAGNFTLNLETGPGKKNLQVSAIGYKSISRILDIGHQDTLLEIHFELHPERPNLQEVVVTGTMKEVSRIESAVPVEIYNHAFFRKNPSPSIFDALQNINGVRPQLNCNICNTGDIHINGMEGPYTMVLIDGMPLVSSLSTVYGLSGIPNSMIERVEIVKGPASSLYGSEAVGGLINIITKSPEKADNLSADIFRTNWSELNADLGLKIKYKKATVLTGVSYFNYQNPIDKNSDNFTDVTLQHRISLFQKWSFERKEKRTLTLAGRFFYEDRWGGEMNWQPQNRGGDQVYGESIYTKRYEMLGSYQLPVKEKVSLSFSYNNHEQNSVYGTTIYNASQHVAFTQLTWDKSFHNHDFLGGIALRYTNYDDNTPATADRADNTWLPGIFMQDEFEFRPSHSILAGMRYDFNSRHGSIFTPRFAYKWKVDDNSVLRLNAGTGFRVVNLFTEDHAALTGARKVEILEELRPERSMNVNLNFLKKIYSKGSSSIVVDLSAWFTRFNNRIIADYQSDPEKIIYNNLNGHAVTRGISANLDYTGFSGLKVLVGATLMDVYSKENGNRISQLLTEPWMGTWSVSYPFKALNLALDYTGNIYGPMGLPVLGDSDPRDAISPVWSIQNIQFTFSGISKIELYGGVKNLLNWTPNKGNPFIIARSDDPFDKGVEYQTDGHVLSTPTNPYALTFDPTYMYAPNQGIRTFVGLRYAFK